MKNSPLYSFLKNDFTPPLLMLLSGILLVMFSEKLPANEGLGWDGSRYGNIAAYFLQSPVIDDYLIMRIYPSALVHIFFTWLHIAFTSPNIIRAFEVINVISLTISMYVIKLIFNHFEIRLKNQLLGFALFYLTYSILKFSFFYPVLTDPSALCMSTLLLYFYVKNQPLNIVLIAILGGFTIPILLYQGMAMLIFPVNKERVHQPIHKGKEWLFSVLSSAYIIGIILYYVVMKSADMPDVKISFTMSVARHLLPFAAAAVAVMYYVFPGVLYNSYFYSIEYLRKHVTVNRIMMAGFVYLFFIIVKHELIANPPKSEYYTLEHFLNGAAIESVARPFMTLVSQTTYFGMSMVLMMFFWKRVCVAISSTGLGLSIAIFAQLFFVGVATEARVLTTIFPWLIIFLMVAINTLEFSKLFYVGIVILNFIISKIWLKIGYSMESGLDEYGTIAFPNQKFFMNIGPWMSEQMWLIQLACFIFTLILITLLLFRVRWNQGLEFTSRYFSIES